MVEGTWRPIGLGRSWIGSYRRHGNRRCPALRTRRPCPCPRPSERRMVASSRPHLSYPDLYCHMLTHTMAESHGVRRGAGICHAGWMRTARAQRIRRFEAVASRVLVHAPPCINNHPYTADSREAAPR